MAGTRTLDEQPRSTAYYYADLERFKRQNGVAPQNGGGEKNELGEYLESNEVVNDGAIKEVPPLRDRKEPETYSTAGTFPMPEQKEKEPLLAELEVVGRVPLTQLESGPVMRRSRSWYLCCPDVTDEEMSRESSWRYSSLRPVTAPPVARQNQFNTLATQSSRTDDMATLRAERDSLARALTAERQRSANAARAHDARLAELHGVIAELVRRRAQDKQTRAIPEEDVSDECESTTQPAGELDNDADRSRTDQNDTSSLVSPAELPTPQEHKPDLADDTDTNTSTCEPNRDASAVDVSSPTQPATDTDTSVNLSTAAEPHVDTLDVPSCCPARTHSGDSCERERGSPENTRVFTASPGRCESRCAKLASRVRLKRTAHLDSARSALPPETDETWCLEAAERLAVEVCAQADLREALVAASNDERALSPCARAWRARCARLEADCALLQCALARASDTTHKLSCACAVQESTCVALCVALRAADRALETYDVLLALAETTGTSGPERAAAELVARQLLVRLDEEEQPVTIGEPLLSPGPWLQHDANASCDADGAGAEGAWSGACEARLRAHAARLKGATVSLRARTHPPRLASYTDTDEEEVKSSVDSVSMAEMEAAVMLQEVLCAREAKAAREARAASQARAARPTKPSQDHKSEPRRRERHWLDARASETEL